MTRAEEAATRAGAIYANAVVIDGLNTSRWGNKAVYRTLQEGGVTAINATTTIWEGFQATLDHIVDWLGWFERYGELIRPVRTVADIRAAK